MILLQACLLPLSILLLLGAIFVIGCAGVKQSDSSTWTHPDITHTEARDFDQTTDSNYLT